MAPKCNLSRLSHVVYERPEAERFTEFAKDFGFEQNRQNAVKNTLFFKGYGKDPYVYISQTVPNGSPARFIGGAFVAQTEDDYNAALRIEGAEEIDISSWPAGGKMVRLLDPNGYEMRVMWGQQEQELPEHGISVLSGRPPMNGALDNDKSRRGELTRMTCSPAMIHKIGHFGYETDNYEETCKWYSTHFNLRPTDVLYEPGNERNEVATFYRVDLGQDYSDHHCFLVTRHAKSGTKVHHSSFEVEDFDTQMIGHQWLTDRNHSLVWGIGRHVHGSQIFDYWFDPDRFIVEHYADGDVVNETYETLRAPAGNMAVWGPPVPALWGGKKQIQISA